MESVSTQTDSMSHNRNAARVKRDEAELQALLKEAGVTEDTEESVEAEAVEEVSDTPKENIEVAKSEYSDALKGMGQ